MIFFTKTIFEISEREIVRFAVQIVILTSKALMIFLNDYSHLIMYAFSRPSAS